MYKQDYIMRLIRESIKFLAKIFLHIKDVDETNYDLVYEKEDSQTDYLHSELLKLIKLGEINKAENLLFENLDTENKKHIELALDFYNRLNHLDDEFLEESNFSRGEIVDGLKDIAKEFGLQNGIPFLE